VESNRRERGAGSVAQRGESVRKRGWGGITIDILEATLTPEKKMRIMYRANLNFERFNRYFYDLLRKGFIEEVNDSDGRSLYRISKRGKTLLETLRKARDLFSSEEC
jgi:predicted transcriptional regulator